MSTVYFKEPKIVEKETSFEASKYGKVVIGGLERGYGTTLGNAMRRVLLFSLPGAAVTGIKVEGVHHEFETVPGVKEDLSEIILNLKRVAAKTILEENFNDDEMVIAQISKTGTADAADNEVTAGDITGNIEICNPELHIATLEEGMSLDMYIAFNTGRGYVPASDNDNQALENVLGVGAIAVDSIYTPVEKVNYTVETDRQQDDMTGEKLILEVWTDGSIEPSDAISKGAKVLSEHLAVFMSLKDVDEFNVMKAAEVDKEENDSLDMLVDEVDFSKRVKSCLAQNGIVRLGELVEKSEAELSSFRNFGDTSLRDVRERLAELGLSLRSDEE
ncbi:MAG: DNA-directed RNA polymerase subunit alpha [Clostridia bacterium]|nr:DNA-directed RNA polymerase subunit alpha [Clostridia bacterium]